MTYTISGSYVAGCSCSMLCGCAVDAMPRDDQGRTECRGNVVFHIAEGRLDNLDLSGVDFAFYNFFPSNLTSGNWTVGLVVDSSASDEQANAVEAIISGREGGAIAELAQFIGDYKGMKRANVSITDGERPRAVVEGMSEFAYEPLAGPDGNPTKMSNAPFGFAPEFELGRVSGSSNAFDITFDGAYGEKSDFTFSSEEAGAGPGRV